MMIGRAVKKGLRKQKHIDNEIILKLVDIDAKNDKGLSDLNKI